MTKLQQALQGERIVGVDDETHGGEDEGYVVLHLSGGGRLYADAPTYHPPSSPSPRSTPNGYDPAWVEAIDDVLHDREAGIQVSDLDDAFWERHIGPAVDSIEDGKQLRECIRRDEP